MSCVIIILGSPNDKKGQLLPIAISRAEAGLLEYKKNTDYKVLCTGGFGASFNATNIAHGQYLQTDLIAKGVSPSSFLDVTLSAFTLQDATLSKPILAQHSISRCILVTSDFHMERAKLVFNHVFPQLSFEYVKAETVVSKVEFDKLVAHEKKAIKRELTNFSNASKTQ